MKTALIILGLLTLGSAGARADSSNDVFGKRYTKVTEVASAVKHLPGWDRNMAAVGIVFFTYDYNLQDSCTGTKISKNGHFLIDLHCLTHCLNIHPDQLKGSQDSGVKDPPVLYRFDRSNVGRKCEISFESGKPTLTATVVAMGQGYINFLSPKNGFQINREQFASWLSIKPNENDYAIIQVKGFASKACAPLSTSPLSLGEKVWALSFPGRTTRDDGSKIVGNEKLFTSGYVRDFNGNVQSEPSESVETRGCSTSEPLPPDFARGYFSSSLDVAPGASGSAIFDENGKIMGLLRSESIPTDENCNPLCLAAKCPYRDGMAIGIDIQTVVSNVRQNFGDQVVNESFNCQ